MGLIFRTDNPELSSRPAQFTKVAHIVGKGFHEVFFWYPVAPPGYASLGCVVTRTDEAPRIASFCCPRMDLVNQVNIVEVPISRFSSSKASNCWSIWKVENQVKMGVAELCLSLHLCYAYWQFNLNVCLKLNFLSIFVGLMDQLLNFYCEPEEF